MRQITCENNKLTYRLLVFLLPSAELQSLAEKELVLHLYLASSNPEEVLCLLQKT